MLPVLLLVLFGIIDFGLMLNRQLLLTEAAREGARVAALGGDSTAVRGAVDRVLGTPPTAISITACDPATPEVPASVSLTFSYQAKTPLGSIMLLFGPGIADTVGLDATGVMACAG